MFRLSPTAVLAVLIVMTSVARGQESVTFKWKTPGPGDNVIFTKDEIRTTKFKVEDGQGNVLVDSNEVRTKAIAYMETVLERDGLKPVTKFERQYTKCYVKKESDVEDIELKDRSVVFEKSGEKYAFAYKDGTAVAGKAASMLTTEMAHLSSSVDFEIDWLPKAAVKLGDKWDFELGPLIKGFEGESGLEVDNSKSTGRGKLIKIRQKDGRQFGEIHYSIVMPIRKFGPAPVQFTFDDGAKLVVDAKMDICIDGSARVGVAEIRMELVGTASTNDAVRRIDILSLLKRTSSEPAKK